MTRKAEASASRRNDAGVEPTTMRRAPCAVKLPRGGFVASAPNVLADEAKQAARAVLRPWEATPSAGRRAALDVVTARLQNTRNTRNGSPRTVRVVRGG